MADLVTDIGTMQRIADSLRSTGKHIALVPTMGALHEGHLSLIRIAKERAEAVITTVFVNPKQFGQGEDLEKYPRMLETDLDHASGAGSDVVFAPEASAMYPPGYRTWVQVEEITTVLEGAVRPGHFRGVATAVTKLFHITHPHIAVFGQKDAQQVAVIRRMVRDLDFGIEIVVAPTKRDPDGLAMSSRNAYLNPEERRQAPVLYRSLQLAERLVREGEWKSGSLIVRIRAMITGESSGVIDYVSVADIETLREVQTLERGKDTLISLAVRFGTTRLIDNIVLRL